MTPESAAIILYGRAHFYRLPRFAPVLAGLQDRLMGQALRIAHEDLSGPALPDVIDALTAEGITHITVIPCGLPADLSLTRWLPGALAAHLKGHDAPPTVEITDPVEAHIDFDAALDRALQAGARTDVASCTPSMGKPGWTDVPDHASQVFFCMGARCAHRGAHAMFHHLRRALRDQRGLASGARRVMCARSSCLFPCNQGPLMVVHPDGVWYGGLTPDLLDRIVRDHLLGGQPVAQAVIHQQPPTRSGD